MLPPLHVIARDATAAVGAGLLPADLDEVLIGVHRLRPARHARHTCVITGSDGVTTGSNGVTTGSNGVTTGSDGVNEPEVAVGKPDVHSLIVTNDQ